MRSISALSTLVASAAATGVLLPLYTYPSAVYNDGAADWDPAFNAIEAYPSFDWLAVIDPGNGPGPTYEPGNDDINYISGVSQLNDFSNVKTIGYVRTFYSTSPLAELEHNITVWHDWSNYTESNIGVKGLFFDETSDDYDYLSTAIAFARQTFADQGDITVICNFGATAATKYYDICDVVIAFESYLNNADAPQYKSETTLEANIPTGYESQAAIIVHDFTGTAYDGSTADASLLSTYIDTIKSYGVGWAYFCSADYSSITTAPATVGQLAEDLA